MEAPIYQLHAHNYHNIAILSPVHALLARKYRRVIVPVGQRGSAMGFRSPDIAIVPRHPLIIGERMLEQGAGSVQRHIYPANGRVTCEIKLASPDEVGGA